MADRVLGVITPGGAAVPATANQSDPTAKVTAYAYRVQHMPGNTGRLWVGDPTLDVAFGQGIIGWEPAPGDGGKFFESKWTGLTDQFNMADIRVDTDVPTDSVLISYTER